MYTVIVLVSIKEMVLASLYNSKQCVDISDTGYYRDGSSHFLLSDVCYRDKALY